MTVDSAGTAFGVVSVGASATAITTTWSAQVVGLGRPRWTLSADSHTELAKALSERLAGSRTGLRLMAAGPERDVLAIQAQARAAGMIDAEMTAYVTSALSRRIYCVHCSSTLTVEAAVGEVVRCGGCGRTLLIDAHLSRYSGAYLASKADAEGWT